jgi:hypothetical protein
MNSSEKAAILRSVMKAGRNLEQAASILQTEWWANPDAFPEVTRKAEKLLRDQLAAICKQVLQDMPHLAGDPEAIADEGMRRLKVRFEQRPPNKKGA